MKLRNPLRQWIISVFDKIVYASTPYVSLKSAVNDMATILISFERTPQGPEDVRILEVARLLRPVRSSSLTLVRVGGESDGGYVMAEDFSAVGAVSIGVGSDVSWDADMASRGLPVALFDPTITRPPKYVPNSRFFRVGVGRNGHRYRPLEELIQMSEFSKSGDLILKIDVEGAEWDVLSGLDPDLRRRFLQIIIEFHNLRDVANQSRFPKLIEVLHELTQDHLPIHIHANNYDDIIQFNSYWFANAVEMTYLRRDRISSPTPAAPIDTRLDRPCDPRTTDISLQGLGYVSPLYAI